MPNQPKRAVDHSVDPAVGPITVGSGTPRWIEAKPHPFAGHDGTETLTGAVPTAQSVGAAAARFKWPADGRGAWPCLAICLSAGGMRSNDRHDRHLVGQLASDRLEAHGDLPAHRGHRRAAPFHGGRETRVLQPTTSPALHDRPRCDDRPRSGSVVYPREDEAWVWPQRAGARWVRRRSLARWSWTPAPSSQITSSALEPVRSPPDDDGCAV